ncbi:endonuclease NucS, partial [Dehalococcoidia bacterium]|nr:endonuclease NucS [Dehalococcoidia bacterium]
LGESSIPLEKEFEDWITSDSSLLQEGLTIVGRQLRVAGGILDLLALDIQGRWVIIELKRSRLRREVLIQAIDYASSISEMGDDEIERLLLPDISNFGDSEGLSQRIQQQLELEKNGEREITILVGGAGIEPGLERIIGYLERFDFPITTVSFQLFDGPGGLLLSREISDEVDPAVPLLQSEKRRVGKALTLDEHREKARSFGVAGVFESFIRVAERGGLGIRPYVHSVMITPPENRTRCLIVLTPKKNQIQAYCSIQTIRQFFPDVSTELLKKDIFSRNIILEGSGPDEKARELISVLDSLGNQLN